MKEIRLLSTSAILGYGFPEASLQAGMARAPHVIGVDGGSVDPSSVSAQTAFYVFRTDKGFVVRDCAVMPPIQLLRTSARHPGQSAPRCHWPAGATLPRGLRRPPRQLCS